MLAIPDISARRAALAERFPDWPNRTLAQAFDDAAARYTDRPLFTNEQGSWTYGQMQAWSRRLAAGLVQWGVKPGDHVALLMANYAEFVAIKLAVARVGAVTIPVNFNLRGAELRYVIDQSDAVLLLTMDQFRGHDYLADLDRFATGWRSAEPASLADLREVFVLPTSEVMPLGVRTIADLATLGDDGGDDVPFGSATNGDPHATCDTLYTSGTTGLPKGVMLSHDMVLRAGYASALHRAFEDGRTILHALPMYHVFGYVECLVASFFVGGHVVSQLAFEPVEFLELARRHHANDMVCLPNMTLKLLDLARADGFELPALHSFFNSGGVNPPSIWQGIRDLLKPEDITTAYGMSETTASTVCTLPEGDDRRLHDSNGCYKLAGVAGDPAIGGLTATYKVIDPESGEDLPYGAIGELLARGPIVTRGYYKKPEETAAAFTGGWLHTGDLGRITEDGYLTLTGRLKESYRCGGEMVMPREIEALVEEHPLVDLALAVGVPDVRMGDVGCLCIVASPAGAPESAELLALCAAQLARFKVPRHVVFLAAEDVPMTSTGRPQKVRLAAMMHERLTAATLTNA